MIRVLSVLVLSILLSAGSCFAAEVNGTIKYEGKIPKLRPVKLQDDPDCMSKHSTPPISEALVLGDGNTMGNVFVQIKGVPKKDYPVPSEPLVISQEGCIYKPHVSAAMAGQTIKFLNNDGILHNVHAKPKINREFNLGMPASMKEADKKFNKPELMVPLKCDVHPWMQAYVAVMDHPYFAVTSKDGKFSIKNLPAGTYEVEVWHEKLKTRTQSITVAANDTKTVDFTYTRKKKK